MCECVCERQLSPAHTSVGVNGEAPLQTPSYTVAAPHISSHTLVHPGSPDVVTMVTGVMSLVCLTHVLVK